MNADVLETVRVIIGTGDFYDATNGVVFQSALDCWEADEPVDSVTVYERLQANGKLADVGGVDDIAEYLQTVPQPAHAVVRHSRYGGPRFDRSRMAGRFRRRAIGRIGCSAFRRRRSRRHDRAPRLQRAAADLSRIHVLKGIRRDEGNGVRSLNLERDLPTLQRTIRSVGNVRLVVIDPISAYCGKTDSHKNAEVRSLLAPLTDIAANHRVAVVAVTHLNKGMGGKAIYRAIGSLAFAAAARAVWAVMKDRENPKRRLVLPVKNNLSAEVDGLAYALIDGVVCWESDPVKFSADDVFNEETERDHERNNWTHRDEAADWLEDTLSRCSVWAPELKRWASRNITKGTSSTSFRSSRNSARC